MTYERTNDVRKAVILPDIDNNITQKIKNRFPFSQAF